MFNMRVPSDNLCYFLNRSRRTDVDKRTEESIDRNLIKCCY